MDRFVAMIWDPSDEFTLRQVDDWSQSLMCASRKWRTVLDATGLRVHSLVQRGATPVATHWDCNEGVIVGPLFKRGAEKRGRVPRLDRNSTRQVVASGGQALIDGYWGNYVAFWREPNSEHTFVLRDPCGAVPCFATRHHGIDLLFSHADDVDALPGPQFAVDWDYVRAFIFFNYFVTRHTGLRDVTELLGGQRLERRADGTLHTKWLWNAATIASTPEFQSFDAAAESLRAVADSCFQAWGSEYRKILVSLSGGLDSSIVLGMLRRCSASEITAVHYLANDYEQYEVKLARRAAAQAGVELVEAPQDPVADRVDQILNAPRIARPKVQSLAVLIDETCNTLADRMGADAFMLGQGGDNLYLHRSSASRTLPDFVRLRGISRDLGGVAYDAAMLQNRSIWGVAADAAAEIVLRQEWRPFAFLDRESWTKHRPIKTGAFDFIPDQYKYHPWFADAAHLPQGKADHLNSIVALYNYYVHHGRGIARDVVYPHFSQPIAEFVLRTPTHILCNGGIDRALERAAFSHILPPEVMRRVGKGGANHYLLQVMRHNIRFYRTLILEGELVKQDWVDRAKVERMTTSDFIAHGGGGLFVYLLVAAEAWLQTWRPNATRAAA